jgi:hypothetical protein
MQDTDGGGRYGYHSRDSDGDHPELAVCECRVCGGARLPPALALLPDPVATHALSCGQGSRYQPGCAVQGKARFCIARGRQAVCNPSRGLVATSATLTTWR